MNITVEKLPHCKATIRVEVPREKVETERKAITSNYHRHAAVPGFRAGKAPLAMVARRFAKNIEQELRDRLVGEGYREGIKKENLDIITATGLSKADFTTEGNFDFVIEVLAAPEFALPEYKGLEIQVPRAQITDTNVEEAIQNLRERVADYEDINDRAAEMEDILVISYHGFIDGKPIREVAPKAPESLHHGHDFWIKLTEDAFLPGFSAHLVGSKPGETVTAKVTLPADFAIKDIAGNDVTYEVEVVAIKLQKLPELNDEFVRQTQIADDLAAFPAAVRERLEADLAKRIEQIKREQVVGKLNSLITFDLPPQLVNQAAQRRAQELVKINQERGVADEEIIENQDQIIQAAGQQAQFDVKTSFILGKIATAENISASDAEISTEILMAALQAGQNRAQALKAVKNRDLVQRFRENIVTRKTVDLLKDNAKIEEIDTPVQTTTEEE